jgi:flagellar FliL protein
MPIRSAVLMVLADQDSFALQTPEGKKALQKQLKDAINQVLISKEGFGGIDDVYFTSFIIQ